MSENTSYTDEELKKMILVKMYSEGPFTLDEWLRYIKVSNNKPSNNKPSNTKPSNNIPCEFMDKSSILLHYPDFYDISIETRIYNDRYISNIYKVKYIVCQKRLPIVPKEILSDVPIDEVEFNKYSVQASGFKLFRPSSNAKRVYTNSFGNSYGNSSGNSFGSNNRNPQFSIVIKNLPTDANADDVKYELQDVFTNFIKGLYPSKNDINVCKATVLASNGVIKGIAFIDFYNKDHMEDILNSTTKFKIGFNILNIERKKSR